MNDFTKEELEELMHCVYAYRDLCDEDIDDPLCDKLQSMIENYCEHNNDFKVGDLLFNVRVSDEMNKRNQHITGYIDGGYLEEDGAVRSIDGTLVDFSCDGLWYKSKNEAIDAMIKRLQDMKE